MKVKSIIAALFLMGTGLQTVCAQKMIVRTKDNQTTEFSIPQLEEVTFVEDGSSGIVEVGLPVSTMLSPEIQWTADIMIFKDVDKGSTEANGHIIGTPPSDISGNKWYALDYELTDGQESWSIGHSPFLAEKFDDKTENLPWVIWPNSTRWSTGDDIADIYLRRTFTVDHELSDKIFLSCCHDDNGEWYLNGVLIHSVEGGWTWDYGYDKDQIYLTPEQIALIHTDGRKNVLAIHVHNYGGPALADGGLYNGETERNLPTSTMLSPQIQWAADMMVFNDVGKGHSEGARQVIGTPSSDTNGNKWYDLNYELTDGQKSWSVGYSPFLADSLAKNDIDWIIWPNSTRWSVDDDVADIYLRRTFTVDRKLSDKIFLSCCRDDCGEWYLNGVQIYSAAGDYIWSYDSNEKIYLTQKQRALIYTDGRKNVLAIHVHNYGGAALADGGLYEE